MSFTTPHHIPKYEILPTNFFVNYPFNKVFNDSPVGMDFWLQQFFILFFSFL